MSEETMVRHCSPTLTGIKTGNMFSCAFDDWTSLKSSIRRFNRLLADKGLRIFPLRLKENRALIYVWRPARLIKDLQCAGAVSILEELGYPTETPERCITELRRRIGECGKFPHEIGLFLGYPPEDVRGFIEHQAKNCKCTGCWKVYGDVDQARKLFERYRRCTDICCAQLESGKSIERLTVAD